MNNDAAIRRLAAANPVPHDGPLHLPERVRVHARRPALGLAIALTALASAGVALAAGLGAFEGTPAPPDVSTSFSQLNQLADQATQQGFAHRFPQADVSKAHGAIEVQTPDGPEDLWVAPSDQGGQCYFIDWANDPPYQDGSVYGFGGCPPTSTAPIDAGGPVWVSGHPNLLTVSGSVSVDAATVQVVLQDGSTMTLPVVEHVYLGSLDEPAGQTGVGDEKVVKVTAFDASGNQVAQWTSPR
ncbi:MAG TPA: hypothetical protein VJP41_04880 [Gaiellaceae bacterium]|nr:hypothetical protein [Gaiellaceae bacterium]